VCSILDMFTAATEATGNAMMYGLRYLVQYPNVQRKLRDEIYRVVGTERLPGMDDIPQ
jgi:cytochrome P450